MVELIRRDNIILTNGRFRFLLGFNYWPRKLNIRMWRDWDEDGIREDIKLMRDLGIRAIRFFIKDEDFADENASIRDIAIARLRKFLDILHENNIIGFPSLIVGHMSGKNWVIPWTSFDDLYKSSSIEKTVRFIEQIVKMFKDHPAIGGWILSNEISLVKKASNRDEALALLRAYAKTVRSIDNKHIISSGDIPDSYMQETPNVRELVDYVGPHLYLYDSDLVRHGYTYSALLELFSNDNDIPIILEEFGFSTHQFSEYSQAKFINEILYTALSKGDSGAFIWCFSDFIHETDPPYEWRPLELGFGVVRSDGTLKPSAEVVRKFSRDIEKLEDMGINERYRRYINTSIIVPYYLYKDYEFVWYRNALGFWGVIQPIISAYIIAKSIGLQISMIYELDIDRKAGGKKLLIMPSVVTSLASTWRKLLGYIESGGNLYVSVVRGVGTLRASHESPTHLWRELFGVENILEAGSIGQKYVGKTNMVFVKDFGVVRKGDAISLNIVEPIYTYKARAVDAEVIAEDGEGRPVMFRSRRGKGSAYLNLLPIEIALARSETIDWGTNIQKLYESIALDAGVEIPYKSSDPEVEINMNTDGDRDIVIAINHGKAKRFTITSKRNIIDVIKIAGDGNIIEVTGKSIDINIDEKSAIVLLIKR